MKPISFEFVAAGVGRRARIALAKLKPSQVNKERPSWEGNGKEPQTVDITVPITDRGYWEGRYVLTEINLRKADNKTLTINDAMVSVSREKNIVRTTMVGLSGTVKEYICSGDYDINISVGIVAVRDGQIVDEYPADGIKEVREFLEENASIEVLSEFFTIFGITRMVISGFSLSQETHSNRQTISIKALSDQDYTIKSTEY